MVAITDLWKAAGSPTPLRPDKWFKSEFVQEKLEGFALIIGSDIDRDEKGKIIGVPAVLEIHRGGRYNQGTFVSYELAFEYTQIVSEKLHEWFTGILLGNTPKTADKPSSLALPLIGSEDFPQDVRITPDGRVSVYDGIGYLLGNKNPYQVWNDLTERIPLFLQKTEEYKFPGKGGSARLTPVATLEVFVEILVTLPGRIAAQVREKAVRTLIRALKGDPTLVDEILSRIQNPQDLVDLEGMIRLRRQHAYGGELPGGTLDNPLDLDQITSEIKSGYGWKGKATQMTELLITLATHVGDMVVSRDSPHRPYGGTTTKSKSRIIPLTLRSLEKQEILHIYHFQSDYIDDADVVDIFKTKAYPEIAYRDSKVKGVKTLVTHLVAPGGITKAAVERLRECQKDLDTKFKGAVVLDAMRLDELVWGEMYQQIKERYQDNDGKLAQHNFNRKIVGICQQLCDKTAYIKATKSRSKLKSSDENQLSFLSELLSLNNSNI
jgi:hypothetical protein